MRILCLKIPSTKSKTFEQCECFEKIKQTAATVVYIFQHNVAETN